MFHPEILLANQPFFLLGYGHGGDERSDSPHHPALFSSGALGTGWITRLALRLVSGAIAAPELAGLALD